MNKEMSQLYSRVFLQILDSSIAEDFMLRHVFEDFLKLCDHKTGIVDMTRQALSRRLNIPMEVLDKEISKLESPDPNSRDGDFEGRRIERLDEHRDWGWKILNWQKYDSIRTKADLSMRVARHRDKERAENPAKGFQKPTVEEVKLFCSEIQMSMTDAEWFFYKCEGCGWTNGGKPIKSWEATIRAWRAASYFPSQKNPQSGNLPSKAQLSAIPPRDDVYEYARQKGDSSGNVLGWYDSWQKRNFCENGRAIDWKIKLTEFLAKQR